MQSFLTHSINKQRGMSALGWMVAVLAFVSILTLAYKIIPPFYDNKLVKEGLVSIGTATGAKELSPDQLKQKLISFFDLNGVRGIPTKSVEVVRRAETILVNVNYEIRENVFQNIDIVMTFENQLDVSNPDACCVPLIKDEKK